MNYKIDTRVVESFKSAVMPFKGPVAKASKQFPKVFKAIKGKSNGAPFFRFYEFDPQSGIGDMELCVPTAIMPKGNGIILKDIPREKVVFLTHIGPYDDLPTAYKEIRKYIQENKLIIKLPWREVYIKGPGMLLKGNPQKYITEIQFPLKEG